MKHLIINILSIFAVIGLANCAQRPSQNTYTNEEVGKSSAISFGTILSTRQVDIIGNNTGAGGLIGTGVGAGVGSYAASGSGEGWAIAGGAIAGAIIGTVAEQAAVNRIGIEYTVVLESGVMLTLVQDLVKNELPIPQGTAVIVQNTGGFQRVLPATNLPNEITRPHGINVINSTPVSSR
jgi:outer membrane lipoprotein SlyB